MLVAIGLAPTSPARTQGGAVVATGDLVAEGERLVHNMDCNVCHTPKVMTERGPRPDPERLLSGHPSDEALPEWPDGFATLQGWGGLFSPGLTAWLGPWGVSFGSNLTPDEDTGIGSWTLDDFVASMRTGTKVGEVRPFLPPMPTYSGLTDDELRAVFAYLRSIPPILNEVPEPISP
jgi:mono/diheme cytochrome c family protein